jgi:hypothetical protein
VTDIPIIRAAISADRFIERSGRIEPHEKVRPRKGDQRGTKPQSRPLRVDRRIERRIDFAGTPGAILRRVDVLIPDFQCRNWDKSRDLKLTPLLALGSGWSRATYEPQLSSPGLTGRPSIPEAPAIDREPAAYWITRFRG